MNSARVADTIVALATAPGRGALAIVRISGNGAHAIAEKLIDPWPLAPRQASLVKIRDSEGSVLDEGIVTVYVAPASFTGEDAVEVTCHGGPVASALIVSAFVSQGARPAEPGEFTRRAVLNGKLDLLQAEAVGDLVDATSRAAQRVALTQLDGGLSRRIEQLRERILGLEALAAYDIDFPEEDDGPISPARIVADTTRVRADLQSLIATAPTGELVREGAVVVIAGPPNAGKSSLFNALLRRKRAIVTEIPGTTRDALEAVTEADGWPIRLVDTAGLRESDETIERIGIELSREWVSKAHVVLACADTIAALHKTKNAIAPLTAASVVSVRTKADLHHDAPPDGAIAVSAETGAGLRELASAIGSQLRASQGTLELDAPMVTRERHRFALEQAHRELGHFLEVFLDRATPAVIAAVHLREATRHLEELIGTVDVEDVLDRVFRSFCVGK
ncbi:MAG TPA: tRNA uridine-5-carboxymethylaminomethyl(34) synthesis GTPase MnmE [Gemmatimonadaceae bacterium]|nr:tRNA uridine-5-carboxymethylaminomethyl(34) synthesis GTPase MnmE [Gemmatimonadaceae bacterium]